MEKLEQRVKRELERIKEAQSEMIKAPKVEWVSQQYFMGMLEAYESVLDWMEEG